MLKKAWPSFVIVAAVACCVQAYQLNALKTDPSVSGPIIDALVYHREAQRITGDRPAPQAPHWQSPVFPWTLGAVYDLTAPEPFNGLYVQSLLAILIAVCVLGTARLLLPPGFALAAGIAACFYGPLLFYCGQLLPAPLAAFLALVALWIAAAAGPGARVPVHAVIGLVFGFAVAARGNVAPFFFWLAARPWFASEKKKALAATAALVIGSAAGLVPVAVSNYQRCGEFSLVTSNMGVNLYVGNNPDIRATTGIRPGHNWDYMLSEPARNGAFTPFEQSEYFRRRALNWALHNPAGLMKSLIIKASDLLTGMETPRNLDTYGRFGHTGLSRLVMWKSIFCFPFGLVLPLAVFGFMVSGLFSRARKSEVLRDIFFFAVLNCLGIIIFFPTGRYRLAMALALVPVAVMGARHIFSLIRRREKPPVAAIVILLAVFAWSNYGPVFTGPDMKAEAGLQLGWAYMSQHNYAKAAETMAAEVDARPDSADAWRSLGEARDRMGDPIGAISALTRAISLAPGFAHALQHLGAILNNEQKYSEAKEVLLRCVESNPAHPLAWSDLARADIGLKDWTGAAQAAKRGTQINPDHGNSWLYLGIARRRLDDPHRAESVLRKAVELMPYSPRPRYHLARCLLSLDRRAEALEIAEYTVKRWPKYTASRNFLKKLKAGTI